VPRYPTSQKTRKARMGRNPAGGEAIKIKASKKVAFRAAKDLKMAVLTETHSIFDPVNGNWQ